MNSYTEVCDKLSGAWETEALVSTASNLLKVRDIKNNGSLPSEDECRKNRGVLLGSLIACHANVQRRDDVVSFMTSDNWNNHLHERSSTTSEQRTEVEEEEEDEEIIITFVDKQSKEEEEVSIKITKSTQLKILFNQYAENRRLSLRLFRFVYGGSALFLSSAGKQTPVDLGMKDRDIITVINLESSKENVEETKPAVAKVASKEKKFLKKRANKGKQKRVVSNHYSQVIVKTEVDFKVDHSEKLGKIHEEAESQFKLIRQQLNNLVLERSKPKSKSTVDKCKESYQPSYHPSSDCLGGKAGKTHYNIQVGEVTNLYKTSKHHKKKKAHTTQQQKILKIDLHGLTKQESLKSLDENLPIWYERAMSGSYPFVIPVEIICGAGRQVLSEVVEQWIKCNDQVANAPTNRKM